MRVSCESFFSIASAFPYRLMNSTNEHRDGRQENLSEIRVINMLNKSKHLENINDTMGKQFHMEIERNLLSTVNCADFWYCLHTCVPGVK